MKLRRAIKICRCHHGNTPRNWRPVWHKRRTIWNARTVCRRKWKDHRIPFIPDDEELSQMGEIVAGIFAGIAKDNGIELPPELDSIAIDFDALDKLCEVES